MLLWCVSAFLISVFEFPGIPLKDLEVISSDEIWLLPSSEPAVVRLDSDGGSYRFDTGYAGLPSGLSVSPSGRWAVSFQNPGVVLEYNRNDILLEEILLPGTGDILINGLSIWAVDTARGSVVDTGGSVLARNCADGSSGLCRGMSGCGIVSGSGGVFLVEPGEVPEKLASCGSACFVAGDILLLDEGTLYEYRGDTLYTELPYSRISASPDGETVVLWGGEAPLVLE